MRNEQTINNLTLFIILAMLLALLYWVNAFAVSIDITTSSLASFFTIFLSLFLEAIPFILAGVIISGVIQVFVTAEHIQRLIPKNKFIAIVSSCTLGAIFPACECGIVPIIRRLLLKGVPLYAAVGFMLTGPLINPLVLFSTYMAFGQEWHMAIMRGLLGFVAAIMISLLVCRLFRKNELKISRETFVQQDTAPSKNISLYNRLFAMTQHSINEFFQMSKFFIIGALLAAGVQTYLSSSSFFLFGESFVALTVVMMVVAYVLSLCSEADAFIAASFKQFVPGSSLLAFLIYGPMLDLKNTFMLGAVFKLRFVIVLMFLITIVVFGIVLAYELLFVGGAL
ncbi:permease [Bacillus sp. FJAT-45350]|uniref:permease n=1 Tax=Bacillus sp. FJAT-45350 TaxID=2011014 RepID=UPI000BB70FB6|nr:permease [Bacillus sp. FJAT-45350]